MRRGLVVGLIILSVTRSARGQDSLPALSTLEKRVQSGDSLDAQTLFRLALRYEIARRYDDEERTLRAAIAADPKLGTPYLVLGELPYTRDKKLADAERRHEVPPTLTPALDSATRMRQRAWVLNPFGTLHLFEGNPPTQDAVILRDRSAATTNRLGGIGVLAYLTERYDLAYSALDLYWSRRYPNTPDDSLPPAMVFFHGLAATQEGLYDRAQRDLQILVDRTSALEGSDSLLHIPLNNTSYRYVLAIIKERANKPVDAIQLYHDIIARDLGFYMAYAHLSQIYRQYKMWDSATVSAQAAVEADPDDPSLVLDLGVIQGEAGHLPDAIATLKKAVALDPRYPAAWYRLGVIAQQANQSADARDAFTRFIAIAPHQMGTEVADATQRLSALH